MRSRVFGSFSVGRRSPGGRSEWQVPIVVHLGEVAGAVRVVGEVAAGVLMAGACPVLLAVAEVDRGDGDLGGLAVVAVLVLVVAAGELALHEDEPALGEVLADELGLRTPRDAVDEVGDLLAVLGLAAGVAGEPEAGDRHAARGVSELRVGRQPPLQSCVVIHQP